MRTEAVISPDIYGGELIFIPLGKPASIARGGPMRRRRENDRARSSVAAAWRWQQIGLERRRSGHDPGHEAHARRRAKGLQAPFLFFALANFSRRRLMKAKSHMGFAPRIK
jgi:hypothetical protein